MRIKCPNCNKHFYLPSVFEANVENYGSSTLVFRHKKCKTNIAICLERTVKFNEAYVTENSESFSKSQLKF